MPPLKYAKLPSYRYQAFDLKTVQYTNIPLWETKKADDDKPAGGAPDDAEDSGVDVGESASGGGN